MENNKLMDLLGDKVQQLDPESSLVQSYQTKEMTESSAQLKINNIVNVLEQLGKNKIVKD